MSKIYGFEPVKVGPHDKGGNHILYRFENGYGASVIPDPPYEDGRELGCIKWTGKNWEWVHGNPITGSADVVMRIGVEYIEEVLEKISRLTDEDIEQERHKYAEYLRSLDEE